MVVRMAAYKTERLKARALDRGDMAVPALPAACFAKPIEVDDKQYMPGVFEALQNEDWAVEYGGEG